jgi:AAA+ ATPase superfamily predicted ATPase
MDINNLLTEDDVKFLKELAHELKTQDNRCTQKPIIFQIAQPYLRADIHPDYQEPAKREICLGDYDFEGFISEEDIEKIKGELLEQCEYRLFNKHSTRYIEDELKEEIVNEVNAIEDYEDIINFLEWHDEIEYHTRGLVEDIKYEGVFLTNRAAQQHLEANHYHYDKEGKPYTYCINGGWRNPELTKLLEIVEKFDI